MSEDCPRAPLSLMAGSALRAVTRGRRNILLPLELVFFNGEGRTKGRTGLALRPGGWPDPVVFRAWLGHRKQAYPSKYYLLTCRH